MATLVELKARFDEESNIEWARALEHAGVHVVYGLVGLKIHSKIALVVRRESRRMRATFTLRPAIITRSPRASTRIWDCSPADEDIADDVSNLFNYLTGYSAKPDYKKLLVAPITAGAHGGADRARNRARQAGRKAHLIFKMNALVDRR